MRSCAAAVHGIADSDTIARTSPLMPETAGRITRGGGAGISAV